MTTGSFWWLSAVARPWPGMCLTTGRTPPSGQALRERTSKRGDLFRFVPKARSPITAVGAGDRHVGDRHAIDVDADVRKIGRDQPRAEPGRRKPASAIAVVKLAIGGSRGVFGPMGRTKALHAAALLIDQHRRVPAERGPAVRGQPAQGLPGRQCCAEK